MPLFIQGAHSIPVSSMVRFLKYDKNTYIVLVHSLTIRTQNVVMPFFSTNRYSTYKSLSLYLLILLMGCKEHRTHTDSITVRLNEKKFNGNPFGGVVTSTRFLSESNAVPYPATIKPSQWLSVELAPDDSVIGLFGELHGKKIMLFDANRNGSLLDDKPLPQKNELFFSVRRKGYQDEDSIVFLSKFIPTLDFPGVHKYRDYSFSVYKAYRYGKATLDSVEYQFAYSNFSIDPKDPYGSNMRSLLVVPVSDSLPDRKTFPVYYKPRDSIYLGQYSYRFESTTSTGDSIVLTPLGKTDKAEGIIVGNYALPLHGIDALTGKESTLQLTGKYTLLDFWGTWCGPCTELTIPLINLHDSKNRFSFQLVGIAYDADRKDVVNYIQEHDIPWKTLYDERSDKSRGPVYQYKIQAFPTFILIDPSGNIIFRSTGKDAFHKVEAMLAKLLP